MTNKLLFINILILISSLFYCCEIETYDNGGIDGYWKLSEIDSISNGKELNLSDKSIFWAIQAKFIVVQNNNKDTDKIYLRFDYSGDSLTTHSPMFYDKLNGNIKINDISELKEYGINKLEESFFIENMTNKNLILKSDIVYLKFKKF